MRWSDRTTRSDVYSLGVLLYELLTGALPFDPKTLRRVGFAAIVRIIRETDPPKPSTRLSTLLASAAADSAAAARNRRVEPGRLARLLRGDLDWITMKCLEKDRTRRYAGALELAADVRRHLTHQPVIAGPPSAAYRLRKFVKRNTGLVAAVAVVFVVLAAGIVATGAALSREAEQRRLAEAAEREQNRAREEAEQSRAAEAQQRRLAEQRERETAEGRDQLQMVVDFQSSMLSEIDPEQMGRALFADLRARVRESLQAEGVSPEDIDSTVAGFDQTLRRANATDTALKLVDEQVLRRAVKTIETDFADQPLVRAALQQTVATTYREIGRYPPAMPLQEAALRTRRAELGDDHASTLTSINDMGGLLESMGKSEEALGYYREALEGCRRVLGDDHPHTLASISNMGFLLQSMGKHAEAEPYCREALEGFRRVLGDDHPATLISINNMGTLLNSMGKLEEALGYYRDALEGRRRVLGDDHPDRLASINNMGALLKDMGKLEEALGYFREALEGSRRTLGDDHPDTLVSINNMGSLLCSMGKYAEAEPFFREALEGKRRALGDDHPQTLISINNMGFLLRDLGRLREAEAHGAEAVERARRALSDGHWYTAVFLGAYGKTLLLLDRHVEAEAALLEAYEILKAARGAEDEGTITVIKSLADLYTAWHAAEPDAGHDAQAAEWRAKLPEDATESQGDKATKGKQAASQPAAAESQPASRPAADPATGGE